MSRKAKPNRIASAAQQYHARRQQCERGQEGRHEADDHPRADRNGNRRYHQRRGRAPADAHRDFASIGIAEGDRDLVSGPCHQAARERERGGVGRKATPAERDDAAVAGYARCYHVRAQGRDDDAVILVEIRLNPDRAQRRIDLIGIEQHEQQPGRLDRHRDRNQRDPDRPQMLGRSTSGRGKRVRQQSVDPRRFNQCHSGLPPGGRG